jgi:hypothetical protein
MSLADFLAMQEEFWFTFGWLAYWWVILFAVSGILISAFAFFFTVVSTWLDSWTS